MANNDRICVTPKGIASYVHLEVPYAESGKFQINHVWGPDLDADDQKKLKALEEAVDAVAKAKWPKGMPRGFKHPFRDNIEKEGSDGYPEGGSFIVPKSTTKPKTFGRGGKEDRIEASEIYAGAKIRCSVAPFAYDAKGNVGVSFQLVNVQKVGDGVPLVGVSSDGSELDALEDDAADLM